MQKINKISNEPDFHEKFISVAAIMHDVYFFSVRGFLKTVFKFFYF